MRSVIKSITYTISIVLLLNIALLINVYAASYTKDSVKAGDILIAGDQVTKDNAFVINYYDVDGNYVYGDSIDEEAFIATIKTAEEINTEVGDELIPLADEASNAFESWRVFINDDIDGDKIISLTPVYQNAPAITKDLTDSNKTLEATPSDAISSYAWYKAKKVNKILSYGFDIIDDVYTESIDVFKLKGLLEESESDFLDYNSVTGKISGNVENYAVIESYINIKTDSPKIKITNTDVAYMEIYVLDLNGNTEFYFYIGVPSGRDGFEVDLSVLPKGIHKLYMSISAIEENNIEFSNMEAFLLKDVEEINGQTTNTLTLDNVYDGKLYFAKANFNNGSSLLSQMVTFKKPPEEIKENPKTTSVLIITLLVSTITLLAIRSKKIRNS